MKNRKVKEQKTTRKVAAIICIITLMASLFSGFATAGSPPHIASQAAVIIDFDTGEVLYDKEAYSLRSPASMTKIMTAFIVYEQMAAGRFNFNTSIPVSQHARSSNVVLAGAQFAMAPGNHTIETLLRLMMLPSSNGACVAIAEYISGSESAFAALMNSTAQRLGMHAFYVNPHGASRSSFNYVSPHSIALLIRAFIQRYPDILRITSMTSMAYNGRNIGQTNQLLRGGGNFYSGVDGFKTGTTGEAGACLSATGVRNGRRIIVVTMAASVANQRYIDGRALLDYGFAEAARRGGDSTPAHPQFTDVPNSSPAFTAVNWARFNGLVTGTTDGLFKPEDEMTRAQYAIILWRYSGRPSPAASGRFSDVPSSHVAHTAITWANDNRIVTGTGDRFLPEANMTRAQMVLMMYRYNNMNGRVSTSSSTALEPFSDRNQIPVVAVEAMRWAVTHGIITGNAGRLLPNDPITRAQVVLILFRYNNTFAR